MQDLNVSSSNPKIQTSLVLFQRRDSKSEVLCLLSDWWSLCERLAAEDFNIRSVNDDFNISLCSLAGAAGLGRAIMSRLCICLAVCSTAGNMGALVSCALLT